MLFLLMKIFEICEIQILYFLNMGPCYAGFLDNVGKSDDDMI